MTTGAAQYISLFRNFQWLYKKKKNIILTNKYRIYK